MKITVATTLTNYAMEDPGTWGSWLSCAEDMRAHARPHDLDFFVAIEVDARGIEPFGPLIQRLGPLDGDWWVYMLDDRRTQVTTSNRQRHLAMGENLASDYAVCNLSSYLLFLAADCAPPPDVIPKLLELDHPLVGAEVPTYCLSGPDVDGYDFPVQQHMASAACIFIGRDVFNRLRWRSDPIAGMTDDPAYAFDAENLLGIKTYVRKDCVARHYPESIPAIEARGFDLRVMR